MNRLVDYRYDTCGLDNVILRDFPVAIDDAGEEVITIPHVNVLHKVIVTSLALKQTGLQPKELRFIRTELGFTQAQIAEVVRKDAQTVGRWERGEHPIDQASEILVRARALQQVLGEIPPLEDLARRTVRAAIEPPIIVDASDPGDYKLAA